MATKIFVNMAVKDLKKSIDFFTKLGYTFNSQFTNENAASMVISQDIYAMLLTEPFFKGFLPHKEIADASKTSEILTCLSCESKAEVDEMVKKAVEAGATTYKASEDHGFMYGHSFQDLDGHIWEYMWMDPAALQG